MWFKSMGSKRVDDIKIKEFDLFVFIGNVGTRNECCLNEKCGVRGFDNS